MAEAFFHRKTAVFNYFQLAIEILAWTRSRKPLCLQVWNFDPIDSFSQIWSHCSYPKWLDAKLKSSPIFSKVTQIHQAFGILLIETMSPRTFKNRPIWSHCLGVTAKTYNGCIVGIHCISPRDTTYGVFCAKRKVSNSSQCKGMW